MNCEQLIFNRFPTEDQIKEYQFEDEKNRMKIYKFKIWDNVNMIYVTIEGKRTWYTNSKVAKAFDAVFLPSEPSRFEIHQIYLTEVCSVE